MNTSPDALVIGAGPVGLAMASELTRHGLTCRIVEECETPSVWSKAQIVHARTLEIFEDMGLIGAALDQGIRLHGLSIYTAPEHKRVAHVPIEGIDSHFPFLLSIPQRDTERVLAAHLGTQGVPVERGVRLDRFTQDAEGVTAVLVNAAGAEETVRAAWLLGCDGAHSTVRRTLDIPFEGATYVQHLIQADLRIDADLNLAVDEATIFVGADQLMALFALPGEKRFRMVVPLFGDAPPDASRDAPPGAPPGVPPGAPPEPTLADFQAVMSALGPRGAVVSDPAWLIGFRIHCRMVPEFRRGRCFLAGDAAHIHSPVGGQGLNTGIQDAYNLAWKLALVHRGRGCPVLLDSYKAERHPVAAATLNATDLATRGGIAALSIFRHPLATGIRNHVMGLVGGLGLVQQRVSRAVSMVEIGYPDSPVVAQQRVPLLRTHVMADLSTEAPSMHDWLDFGQGPAPGRRAPDVRLDDAREDSPRLYDLLRGTAHTLLLFDGAASTEAGYRNLETIGAAVQARCGDLVRVHLVVPTAERPAALRWEGSVVLDARGALHQRYGARSECLFLVRPDGYVAFRSQPAEAGSLLAFLDRIFTPLPGAAVGTA